MSRHLASGIRPKPYVSASEPALNPTTLVSQFEARSSCDPRYVIADALQPYGLHRTENIT